MAKKSEIFKSFDKVLKECQCAGAAAGAGNISSFAPENVLGVKDIHTKEEKNLKETKYVVAQDCDGSFGYFDDFSELTSDIKRAAKYDSREEAEEWAKEGNSYLEEFGYDGKTWVEELKESEVKPENPNDFRYTSEEKDIEYPKVNPEHMKVNKSLSEAEVKPENPNNYYYSDAEDDIEYSQVNPNNMKVNKKLPENKKCMPRQYLNESRALPGGMLNSEEHTAYEDWLRDRHQKQDKVKAKEYGKNKLGLYDDECGENGWHNWDGTKIERKRKFD